MPIILTCPCGRMLRAKDDQAGRACRCPACGTTLQVPYPVAKAIEPPPEGSKFIAPDVPAPTSALSAALHIHRAAEQNIPHAGSKRSAAPDSPTISLSELQKKERTWRGHVDPPAFRHLSPHPLHLLPPDDTAHEQLKKLIEQYVETRPRFEHHTIGQILDDILRQLPGHRLDGAFLSRDSHAYFLLAALSALLFFAIAATAIPADDVEPLDLLLAGLFTATIGIALLLTFQYFSICFCLIGIWYVAAESPTAPFGPSLLGFVLGVGVCEEITKCIPVLWRIHRYEVSWRACCLIGMASGVGFGIAEGIDYCANHYNGIAPFSIYLVRFLSNVSHHAMLSGACGILIFRHRKHLGEWIHPYDWILTMTAIMLVPILLHGLFDAAFSSAYAALALLTWLATFAWLSYLITSSRNREVEDARKSIAGASKIIKTEKGTRYIGTQ